MPVSAATDGFRLVYDRAGHGAAVLLLHGWPGDRADYRQVVPRLAGFDVIAADLRGFGESAKHLRDPPTRTSARSQRHRLIEGSACGWWCSQAMTSVAASKRVAADRPDCCARSAAAARRRHPGTQRRGAARVLVPVVPPARPGGRAHRRKSRCRPRVPCAFLVALVGALVQARGRGPRPAGAALCRAGGVHRVNRLVPGGRGHGRPLAGRARTRPGRPDPGTGEGALASA